MFQWMCEEKRTTTASPEAIWEIWSDLGLWPQWDTGVAWAKLESTFSQGEYMSMKPVSGPEVRSLLEEVTVLRSFTTCSQLPLTKVRFMHFMDGGTVIHRVEMRGLLAPLFRRLFGSKIQQELPDVLQQLVCMAEEGNAGGQK